MTTRVWDYLPEYAVEKDDILDAVQKVFESGQLVLGESVKGFEAEFAAYHGLPYATGVDNGTNALKLALEALGVGPGDEVITVSNTAAPTVVAIVGTGATPVFVDVREKDFLMDTDQVEAAVTPRTKVLLPVHLYGQSVDMEPLRRIADKHGLKILKDCAVESMKYNNELVKSEAVKAYDIMKNALQVTELTPAQRQLFKDKAQAVYDAFIAEGLMTKAELDEIKAVAQ